MIFDHQEGSINQFIKSKQQICMSQESSKMTATLSTVTLILLSKLKTKFHYRYDILVADRSEAGLRPVTDLLARS